MKKKQSLKKSTVIALVMLLLIPFRPSAQHFFLGAYGETPYTPNVLTSSFDKPNNIAQAHFEPFIGNNQMTQAHACVTSHWGSSAKSRVFWEVTLLSSINVNGDFQISSNTNTIFYADIAITKADANNIVMYVVTQEGLNNLQYTYLRSYLWNGTAFVFQDIAQLQTPMQQGGDYTVAIDINYMGNFAIVWQRNVNTLSNPNLEIFGTAGKVVTSFPYFQLSSIILNVSILTHGTLIDGSIDNYPDVSINNNNKIAFIFNRYPVNVKLYAYEGVMDFNTFNLSGTASNVLATFPTLTLLYNPRIAYWKNENYINSPPNHITYTGNCYAVEGPLNTGNMSGPFDWISITNNNGVISSPRILNSLGQLNNIQAQFWDHSIVPSILNDNLSLNQFISFETAIDFEDVGSQIYGTSTHKVISRTVMPDNSAPLNEHYIAQGTTPPQPPIPNYLVLSSSNLATYGISKLNIETSCQNPFIFYFATVKLSNFSSPNEIVHGYMPSGCFRYCKVEKYNNNLQLPYPYLYKPYHKDSIASSYLTLPKP